MSCSSMIYVTGFKATFHAQLYIFTKTNFNYLKWCILGRKADDAYMQFATVLAIHSSLAIYTPAVEWIPN